MTYLYIFSKNTHLSNSTTIRPVNAYLLHADGHTDRRTDMTKLTVAFRSSANASINVWEESAEELRDLKLKDKLHGVEKNCSLWFLFLSEH